MPEGFEKQVPPEGLANLPRVPDPSAASISPLDSGQVGHHRQHHRDVLQQGRRGGTPDLPATGRSKIFEGVPFRLVDPRGDRVPNVIMLFGPTGAFRRRCRGRSALVQRPAKADPPAQRRERLGLSGRRAGLDLVIVRLHYAGARPRPPLKNGIHFADYIRRVDVPESKFAFPLRGRQIRYLAINPSAARSSTRSSSS